MGEKPPPKRKPGPAQPLMPSPMRLVYEPRPRRWRLAFWRKPK